MFLEWQAFNLNFAQRRNSSQVFLKKFVYTLGTPPMTSDRKRTTLKFNASYVAQKILLFFFSRYNLYVHLAYGGLFTKTRMNSLINITCFRLWLIQKEKSIMLNAHRKVSWMAHEESMETTVRVWWWQIKLMYRIEKSTFKHSLRF